MVVKKGPYMITLAQELTHSKASVNVGSDYFFTTHEVLEDRLFVLFTTVPAATSMVFTVSLQPCGK